MEYSQYNSAFEQMMDLHSSYWCLCYREVWAIWTGQLTVVQQQQQHVKLADATFRRHIYAGVGS